MCIRDFIPSPCDLRIDQSITSYKFDIETTGGNLQIDLIMFRNGMTGSNAFLTQRIEPISEIAYGIADSLPEDTVSYRCHERNQHLHFHKN